MFLTLQRKSGSSAQQNLYNARPAYDLRPTAKKRSLDPIAGWLNTTTEAKHKMKCRLLLDVVVRKRATVLELLACEDETLLVRRNSLLVLDLGFHVVDGVTGLNIECDGLAGERLDENLHATTEAQHQMERGLLLDVVIRKRAAVLELLAREDQALLVGRDAFFILDLGLHVLDGVTGLDVKGNGLAGERLDKNLHAATEAQHQMERGLLLDVVIRK